MAYPGSAGAVIRKIRAFIGFIGVKGKVDGVFSQFGKFAAQP